MGGFSSRQRELVKRMQHGLCFNCHEELGDEYEVHAVMVCPPENMVQYTTPLPCVTSVILKLLPMVRVQKV